MQDFELRRSQLANSVSCLTAALCLFVAVAAGSWLLADGTENMNMFVVATGVASFIGMFMGLAGRERAQVDLENYWTSKLRGTKWRTPAGETVVAIRGLSSGAMYVRFDDGFSTVLSPRMLTSLSPSAGPFETSDWSSGIAYIIKDMSSTRWRTPDGLIGIVRTVEGHVSDDSSTPDYTVFLKIDGGDTRQFPINDLVRYPSRNSHPGA